MKATKNHDGCPYLPGECVCSMEAIAEMEKQRGHKGAPLRLTSDSAPDLIVRYPDKLRDRIGMFMLRHGVTMGVAVDPGKVQDLIEGWEREAHPGLEFERDRWRQLAQEAIAMRPAPPIVVNLDTRPGGQGPCTTCGAATVYMCPFCKIKSGAIVWLCELAACRDKHEESGCTRTWP